MKSCGGAQKGLDSRLGRQIRPNAITFSAVAEGLRDAPPLPGVLDSVIDRILEYPAPENAKPGGTLLRRNRRGRLPNPKFGAAVEKLQQTLFDIHGIVAEPAVPGADEALLVVGCIKSVANRAAL